VPDKGSVFKLVFPLATSEGQEVWE
jgi:hypothetical protein